MAFGLLGLLSGITNHNNDWLLGLAMLGLGRRSNCALEAERRAVEGQFIASR